MNSSLTIDDDAVVTVRGLTKSYGDRIAVDRLDLDVSAGEVLGLIGANGAGKTTAVECIQGLRRPDAGSVRVLGLDPVRDADRVRQLVGSQLQSSALPDRLRVGEAAALFSTRRARDAEGLLERFGLAGKLTSAFGTMSGGEQQRLFLVLALLNQPRLVILDELTQGLDPSARREVWASVAQLRDAGTTVLLVTHELDEAEVLCDRVVAIRSGRVLDAGTPAELVARHAAVATTRFGIDAADAGGVARQLEHVHGVHDVELTTTSAGQQVAVRGARSSIAHVGAWLVDRGEIPADLRVDVPDLEAALLALLDEPSIPAMTGAQR
jgi:ABC-2 type transport system ATP-binding protein